MELGHVDLGSFAPPPAPVTSAYFGQAPSVPSAPMGQKSRKKSGCTMKRMGSAGTRCRCNGKLVKTSRCRK